MESVEVSRRHSVMKGEMDKRSAKLIRQRDAAKQKAAALRLQISERMNQIMAGKPHQERGVFEHARTDVFGGVPDRHSEGGDGTTKEGVPVHGSYRQPWSESDPVKPDPTSDVDRRSGTKDVG